MTSDKEDIINFLPENHRVNDFQCIHCRMAIEHCVCSKINKVTTQHSIWVIRHPNENRKSHNTSHWLTLSGVIDGIIQWHRNMPDPAISDGVVLFPTEDSLELSNTKRSSNPDPISKFKNWIIIDGTWQEAKKIYNRTPWLNQLPTAKLAITKESGFTLRRNQKNSGLSTFEAVKELLTCIGDQQSAKQLDFELFIKAFELSRERIKPDNDD